MAEEQAAPSFCVSIRFGSVSSRLDLYKKGDRGQERCFATQAELDAYLEGVDDMDGWMEYVITELNGEVVDEDDDIYDEEEPDVS